MTPRSIARPRFVVATRQETWADDRIQESYLLRHRLLKTLSLLLSDRASVTTPPTLLMLHPRGDVIEKLMANWGIPLMIRLDFSSLPKRKALGGIPLFERSVIESVCQFLLERRCYPLIHPHLDRFEDVYSAGILLSLKDQEAIIEAVGTGFDASDLRLGQTSPHESIKIDLLDGAIRSRAVIAQEAYTRARRRRLMTVALYRRYTEYVNSHGMLLPSLDKFRRRSGIRQINSDLIPQEYVPMPPSLVQSLAQCAWKLQSSVLGRLPASDRFVASFSFLPGEGWVLWDIYGTWYRR